MPKLINFLLLCFIAGTQCFSNFPVNRRSAMPQVHKHTSSGIVMSATGAPDSESGTSTRTKTMPVTWKWIPAALAASAIVLNNPVDVSALPSGGRSGGSSFRSSSSYPSRSSSSYGSSSSSRSYGRSMYAPSPVIVAPMYSPFAPSIFNPFGIFSFQFIPMNINLLLFGFTAFALYNFLSNRVGGSNFGNDFGSSSSGATTVAKLQLALSSDWSDDDCIMKTLATVASKYGDMEGRSDLSKLLSEVSLALLRRQSDWEAISSQQDVVRDRSEAESKFQRLAVIERSKFEVENSALTSSSNDRWALKGVREPRPTMAVVTILVALRGDAGKRASTIRTFSSARECLQELAAEALVDDGEGVLAVEVLWTPDTPALTISDRDLVNDYPELLKL